MSRVPGRPAAVLVVGMLALVAACSSSKSAVSKSTASTTTGHLAPVTTTTNPVTPTVSVPPPSTAASTTTVLTSDGAGAVALVGFGATKADWESHHRATTDPGLNQDAVFDADPTLPQVNGHVGYRYYAVLFLGGRAVQYEMALHPTTVAGAKAQALSEFPGDAHQLWFAVKDSCAMMAIRSVQLAKALNDPSAGRGVGQALVEFDTSQPDGNFVYAAGGVDHLLFMLNSDPTPDAAGPC